MMHINPLICLIGTMLFISMQIRSYEVQDPCEFVLDPLSTPLLNDF